MQTYRVKYEFNGGRRGVHFVEARNASGAREALQDMLGPVEVLSTDAERTSRAKDHAL